MCTRTQTLKGKLTALEEADGRLVARMAELKKALYARFGDSINLD
jgi:chaperonin cofactor prefoldin